LKTSVNVHGDIFVVWKITIACFQAGWAPEPVWTQRIEEKSFTPAEDRTPIARSSSP
jgi:hypothetical protein